MGAFDPPDRVIWRHRGGVINLAAGAPIIMGILNMTPDSFSDGGRFIDPSAAMDRAAAMLAEGATILDIGGESSRPGADTVSAREERRRIQPVIEKLSTIPGVIISVDTTKAEVAQAALEAGAHIINDISSFDHDPAMTAIVKSFGAGLVLMHMQGNPKTMQEAPRYVDVVTEVGLYLQSKIKVATAAGIDPDCLLADPGIGFGKTQEHNLALLRNLEQLAADAGRPLLVGLSRKRFIGTITGRAIPDRLAGSLAAAVWAVLHGVRILRVHDVKETCDATRVAATLSVPTGA